MSESDKDGAGYLATSGGSIFGEKWLRNSDAFKSLKHQSNDQDKINSLFEHAVPNSFSRYDYFGEPNLNSFTTILFHTRMATCDKTIYNTHPFVIGDTGLIHNGVILNSDSLLEGCETVSTCDSEAILHEYIKSDVAAEPNNIHNTPSAASTATRRS
jgi:predicted glutamine amidotransferase